MSDLIDRKELNKFLATAGHCTAFEGDEYQAYMSGVNAVFDLIEEVPAVDAVEVVRCKDCVHYIPPDDGDFLGQCTDEHLTISWNGEKYPRRDYFCPYGKRRNE